MRHCNFPNQVKQCPYIYKSAITLNKWRLRQSKKHWYKLLYELLNYELLIACSLSAHVSYATTSYQFDFLEL